MTRGATAVSKRGITDCRTFHEQKHLFTAVAYEMCFVENADLSPQPYGFLLGLYVLKPEFVVWSPSSKSFMN